MNWADDETESDSMQACRPAILAASQGCCIFSFMNTQRQLCIFALRRSFRRVKIIGGNNGCIPPTLEGWVYIIPIHGPLDGPLYTWAQYTPTPPRSLNYRRSGVQDWTTRKLKLLRSLKYRRIVTKFLGRPGRGSSLYKIVVRRGYTSMER